MKTIKISTFLFILLIYNLNVQAQFTRTWTGGGTTDNFDEADNWLPAGTPSSFDTVVFETGTSIIVDQVMDELTLAGLKVIPDISGNPTTVHFNFFSEGITISVNGLIIGEGCSLNYTDPASIDANNFTNLEGGSINITANIELWGETNISLQNSISAQTIINNGTINLNEGELSLNCVLNNLNTINLNNGRLIIEKEFLSDINGFLYGGVGSSLIFGPNVTNVDPISSSLTDLNIFECYAPINVFLTNNLKVWHLLKMMNGILDFTDHELTLSGDFLCEGGVLGVSAASAITIEEGGSDVQSNLSFNVTGGNNDLNSLILNRPDKIIDIDSDLVLSDNLNLIAGKLKVWDANITLNPLSNVAVSDVNFSYIVTGPTGTVSATLNAGDAFFFPVGSLNYSAPVNIASQVYGEYFVNVKDLVYSTVTGGDPLSPDAIVNLTWDIQAPSESYNLMLNWDPDAEGSLFLSSDASVFHYNELNHIWDNISVTNSGTQGSINVDTDLSGLFMVTSQSNPNLFIEDQVFEIQEFSPDGTVVGQLQAIDLQADISYEVLDHNNADAFDISSDGIITVTNSSLLVKADNPEFKYPMIAYNNTLDISSNFLVSILLTEQIQREIIITNFISPNGDGVNDTWIVKGPDIGQFAVSILDKRGNIVYRSDDYMNDWNGTMNGTRLSPGVYYYIVRSANIEEKGTITLVR